MGSHDLKFYTYHLTFLKDFPELDNWLVLNGYTILHSHQDFAMQVQYTFWDDHSADAGLNTVNDAKNSLMIAYCEKCKTVEVYHRAIITKAKNEKALVKELDRRVAMMSNHTHEETGALKESSAGRYPNTEEISDWIDSMERQ
jgi:hypothetical protein